MIAILVSIVKSTMFVEYNFFLNINFYKIKPRKYNLQLKLLMIK